ncbi:T9SS type A sorting domain-containing protein [Flavobacterium sp. AS60]|uniref:DUF7619 domain-containing protein n=1 Tax=Flavobacterium anseongense TaxID=2910677 RepID=UPI001F15BED9|nr:T9SS type A sorting domain-containing protein [Flavobacterium sp. AS60]MCF6129014.1 T9SS type A sorting domain-containing protein [Flavobacterium sp. AS60]
MKKLYFSLCFIFIVIGLKAQTVSIPDPVFKQLLVTSNSSGNICAFDLTNNAFSVDANNDGEIQVSEALQVGYLDIDNGLGATSIGNLEGIQSFTNLIGLNCANNMLTSLNVSGLSHLVELTCTNNQLTSLNLNGCVELMTIYAYQNQFTSMDLVDLPRAHIMNFSFNPLTSLNISGCPRITQLACDYTQLITLDVSSLSMLAYIYVTHCPQLTSIFAKNGSNESYAFDFSNSPNVTYICADESQLTTLQNLATTYGNTSCTVNSYCSFIPGGNYYTTQGTSTYDGDNNGCGGSDAAYQGLRMAISGSAVGSVITNASGNYVFDVPAGTYTVTPSLENPSYFLVSPTNFTVTFPGSGNPNVQNFCIRPNGTHRDVDVTILPMIVARPGFDAYYKIIYKNKGTHPQTGTVTLTFQDDMMDYVSSVPSYSSQSTNLFAWDYSNLLPFETREILITFNVNSPVETPPVNIGDELSFTAVINPVSGDDTYWDNTNPIKQTVVGSLDPNDKACAEGALVTTSVIGEYVHYLIRFENTGNYPAENVVIKDIIDTNKFTATTLLPISSSHPVVTKFSSPNKVEFIFENINLPFDDANNDGYVAFKIRTRPSPTLSVGSTFSNTASIYFDYNAPIITNTFTSTIQALGNQDFEFSDYVSLYPNPARDILNIQTKNDIQISSVNIYNTLGQLVLVLPEVKDAGIDVSDLVTGTYFIKINSDKGSASTKFIKD